MLKQDEHMDLCDSGCQSIIPYVHERERESCIVVCVLLFKAELNFCKV
jgi:hypothetical protein